MVAHILNKEFPLDDLLLLLLLYLHYDASKQEAMIEQRNYFKVGDTIEFFSPHHENILIQVKEIYNEDREAVEVANHPMEILYLKCEQPLSEFDILNGTISS